MKEHKMWIGGEFVGANSGKTFRVINPATEEEIAQVPLAGESDVEKAVFAAKNAYPVWSAKTLGERAKIVNQIAVTLRDHAEELAKIETMEHGWPSAVAGYIPLGAAEEVEYSAWASRSVMGEVLPAFPDKLSYLRREPVGVCALIIPWNAALLMTCAKLAPALAMGNTCVVKLPSLNPLTGLRLAELISGLDIPPGTVNILTGPGGQVGEALASHPDVDLIGFTGSSEVGKRIMPLAGPTVKHLILELGGKNPILILEDADLAVAAKCLAASQYNNSGQVCASPGRYYIHENVYDAFVDLFIEESKKVVVGDPRDEKTTMGPLVSATHLAKVEALIRSGLEEGATLALGGSRPNVPHLGKGFFLSPTVLTNVTHTMKVATEEIFGPVACLIKYSSKNDILALANDSKYGLSATIWTKNTGKGIQLANAMRSGSVYVNSQEMPAPEFPWGGIKQSGIGKEGSVCGLLEFSQLKLICVGN